MLSQNTLSSYLASLDSLKYDINVQVRAEKLTFYLKSLFYLKVL